MTARADGYSRFVVAAKIVLPIGAIALLSTLFFFSGRIDPTQSIPFKELDVATIAREQRISGPVSTGVTQGGSSFTLRAERALPDLMDEALTYFKRLNLELTDPGTGVVTTLTAPEGSSNTKSETTVFSGGTRIVTSDGMQMDTDTMRIFAAQDLMESDGAVTAVGDFGRLTAGKMRITQPEDAEGQVFVFTGGVNLLYDNSGDEEG